MSNQIAPGSGMKSIQPPNIYIFTHKVVDVVHIASSPEWMEMAFGRQAKAVVEGVLGPVKRAAGVGNKPTSRQPTKWQLVRGPRPESTMDDGVGPNPSVANQPGGECLLMKI